MPVLKNSGASRQSKGLLAELVVSQKMIESGHSLLGHRLKTPFAELDLVFRSPIATVIVLEVKFCSYKNWDVESLISQSQRARLKRACGYLEQEVRQVELLLAVIDSLGEMVCIPDL